MSSEQKVLSEVAIETLEEKTERLKIHTLTILNQEIKVSLPPISYTDSTVPASITDETLKTNRVFLIIHDSSKFDSLDPYNEFRNHLFVEVVDNTTPLRTCIFKNKKIKVHEGSDCMTCELGKEDKIEFLDSKQQEQLSSHLGHKGLYIALADPKWIDNSIYVKMLSKTKGEFQGQEIEVSSLKSATF